MAKNKMPTIVLPYKLPGGRVCITREENARVCKAIYAEEFADGRAHPIYYYIATQRGMGVSVEELLGLCDFDVADGPLMISTRVRFHRQILTEQAYEVSGQIVSLKRKSSRTFGKMDLLEFALRLSLPEDETVIECVNSWALPRREIS